MVLLDLVDDPEGIRDDDLVYRRVCWDHVGGRDRFSVGSVPPLSGNAFRDFPAPTAARFGFGDACMSVGVESVLAAHGHGPDMLVKDHPGYGLASISAGTLRRLMRVDGTSCAQGLLKAPTDAEPWHGVVFDLTSRPRSGAVSKRIAAEAEWVIPLVA